MSLLHAKVFMQLELASNKYKRLSYMFHNIIVKQVKLKMKKLPNLEQKCIISIWSVFDRKNHTEIKMKMKELRWHRQTDSETYNIPLFRLELKTYIRRTHIASKFNLKTLLKQIMCYSLLKTQDVRTYKRTFLWDHEYFSIICHRSLDFDCHMFRLGCKRTHTGFSVLKILFNSK